MERTGFFYNFLKNPRIYDGLQNLLAPKGERHGFIARYLEAEGRGVKRILDLGCGPGNIVERIPEHMEYVGVDYNADYIREANERYGDRGVFLCADLENLSEILKEKHINGRFDLVLMMGFLHHMPDDAVLDMLKSLGKIVPGKAVLLSLDPTRVKGQHPISRFLVSRDRGRFVRSPEAYAKLFEKSGFSVDVRVHDDLLRVPYHHCIIQARPSLKAA